MSNPKKVVVFGFGKEGVSAANYLGSANSITIIEDKPVSEINPEIIKTLKVKTTNYFSGEYPKNPRFELIVRSPGFRADDNRIQYYLSLGAKLTSPTNIFFENCPAKTIGVTGTKGKGTTSSLIFEILKKGKNDVYLAGNIGTPMLDILSRLKKTDIVVLELSSFQLLDIKFSPHIALILMITSEHLNWHTSQEEYLKAKQNIVKFQDKNDYVIINTDYKNSNNFKNKSKAKTIFFSTKKQTGGVYVKDDEIFSSLKNQSIIKTDQILLPGRHNLQNICAAVLTSEILNIPSADIINTVKTFKGLTHRLQLVKEIKGVKYINDSYSTIPDTAIAAIRAFSGGKILILGGSSKKSDFSQLSRQINSDKNIRAVILIGSEAINIKKAIHKQGKYEGEIVEGLTNMKDIVQKSSQIAQTGDHVILSPACASFDMFKNYENRGNEFINEVTQLV